MNTIHGPVRGVLRAEPPELRPVCTHGGWQVRWVQLVREEAGWDTLDQVCSDLTVHPTQALAQAAADALLLAGEQVAW